MNHQKSVIRFGVVTIMAGLAGFTLTFKARTQSSQPTYVPFTAHEVKQEFASATANKPVAVEYITIARRSDGSEAKSTTVNSPDKRTAGWVADIVDLKSLKRIAVDSLTKSTMTFYLSPTEMKQVLYSTDCPANVNTLTDHSTILGYDAVRRRIKYGSQPRYSVDDRWIAPALACLPLKDTYVSSRGPWNLETTVSLTVGEPSSSLFAVPSGYVERTPTEVESVWSVTFPGYTWMPTSEVEGLERNYDAHRQPQ
jgi:hypothetical protein